MHSVSRVATVAIICRVGRQPRWSKFGYAQFDEVWRVGHRFEAKNTHCLRIVSVGLAENNTLIYIVQILGTGKNVV